jgi:hypothetical protein
MANLRGDLPSLLRAAGLRVVEIKGWRTRGRPARTGGFAPVGVLNHHTGSSARGWTLARELSYAKWLFLTGRRDLPAPLCHLSLGRSGTVYVGAAGRANHAGKAKASGSVAAGDGNSLYIGIEWMLSGTERIPASMMEAGAILNAVLTEHVTDNSKGTTVNTISCHYQTSVTGKWDIGDPEGVPFKGRRVLDVPKFRRRVSAERVRLYHRSTSPAVPAAPAVPRKVTSTKFQVATNNIMSLPPNPTPRKTLRAAPRASVVMLQEADRVHDILRGLPGSKHHRKTAVVPNGNRYAEFVLYDPAVWAHVSTEFFLAYRGSKHISLSRHIAVTVLRHKALDREFAFISYHAVTSGKDRIRARLRGEGDAAVRRQIRRFRNQGIPIILGADLNRKTKVFTSASLHVRHWVDHLLGWSGRHVALRMSNHYHVNTRSDHDTLVAEFTATAK